MKNGWGYIAVCLSFFCVLLLAVIATAHAQQVASPNPEPSAASPSSNARLPLSKDIPEKIDVQAKYLFYLHGKIIEDEGIRPTHEKFGVYEYEEILSTFQKRGFAVISEARSKDTDVNQYASKVVGQINALLAAGVPPQQITVVGASKGALIAMRVSTMLKNREVNFIIIAGCSDIVRENFDIDLHGNILSIYDVNDEIAGPCQKFFDKATGLNRHKEVELKVGTGHGVLYKPMNEWVDPVVEWAEESRGRNNMSKTDIEVGKTAPTFSLDNQDEKKVSLKDFAGRWVVLYFYPKDDTPGCTTEACEFTNEFSQFEQLNAVVLGVSPDSPASHRQFIEKHNLKITLLSDPDRKVIETYGAWGMKKLSGREILGVIRSTVLIDPEGKIGYHWPNVTPAGHAEEVREKLAELQRKT